MSMRCRHQTQVATATLMSELVYSVSVCASLCQVCESMQCPGFWGTARCMSIRCRHHIMMHAATRYWSFLDQQVRPRCCCELSNVLDT
jgi:hypothetical protein